MLLKRIVGGLTENGLKTCLNQGNERNKITTNFCPLWRSFIIFFSIDLSFVFLNQVADTRTIPLSFTYNADKIDDRPKIPNATTLAAIQEAKEERKTAKTYASEVIDCLMKDLPLPEKYCDHQLKGNLKDYRDCHVENDLVLLYSKYDDEVQHYLAKIIYNKQNESPPRQRWAFK